MRENLPVTLEPGQHTLSCRIPSLPLYPRRYNVSVEMRDATGTAPILPWNDVCTLTVDEKGASGGPGSQTIAWMGGPVRVRHSWTLDDESIGPDR
jgi:hypothetical protein